MAAQADTVYRSEDQIVSDVLTAWTTRIPDIGIGPGTIVRIWSEVFANSGSGFFLGLQLLHDDMFVQSMSALALQREGEEIGRPQKAGVLASGEVTFEGAGGTFVGSGSIVGAPRPSLGDTLQFETTEDGTIPNPGVPTAPTTADSGTAGNPDGTLEYAVTFTTAEGETAIGAASASLVVATNQVDLSNIPIGGAGTTSRRIYRSKNGGSFQYVAALADNSTTIYVDNIADGALGGNPPTDSTAEKVTVTAQALQTGVDYDVAVGTINTLVDVDGDVTGVTNSAAFSGGEDPEAIEVFRQELLQWKQAPQSGSPLDLVAWATSIDGIDSAAVFKNVNLAGAAELGSVVVRVSGVDGSTPDADLVSQVQDLLDSKDLANITIYVGTFDPLDVDATVAVTITPGFVLADATPSVDAAISDYVNSVPVGGTIYVAGIIRAVFGLPGIDTVQVTAPAADVTSTATEKPVIGTVTVNEA